VICEVFLTDLMRRLKSRVLAMRGYGFKKASPSGANPNFRPSITSARLDMAKLILKNGHYASPPDESRRRRGFFLGNGGPRAAGDAGSLYR